MPAPSFKTAFVGSNAAGFSQYTSTSVTLSNIAANDFLLLVMGLKGTGIAITTPTGWTLIGKSTTDPTLGVFYKVAAGGETGVTIAHGTAASTIATVYVSSSAVLDVAALGASAVSTTTPSSPSVDTTGPDRLIIAGFVQTTGGTWTAGSSMTKRSDARSGTSTSDVSNMTQDAPQAAQGATGTKTATSSVAQPAIGVTVALLSGSTPLAGRASPRMNARGLLAARYPLSGGAQGSPATRGVILARYPLSGRAQSGANASGAPRLLYALSGRAQSGASVYLIPSGVVPARGIASAGASARGLLVVRYPLFGRAQGGAAGRGSLFAGYPLSGRASSGARTQAAPRLAYALQGRAQGGASGRGVLYAAYPLAGRAQGGAKGQGRLLLLIRVSPDAILSQTNLVGSVSAIQDDPDSPDSNWLLAP